MDLQTETTETNNQQEIWQEAAAASAEAQRAEEKPETICDVIKVPVTLAMKAKIAEENAADDAVKSDLESELERLKEQVKETKSRIDEIDQRMSERHEAVRTGVQSIKGEWVIREIFETNAIQYLDPKTLEVVHERPMSPDERQQDLFASNRAAPASDGDEDDALLEDEEEPTDLEDRLDAALDGADAPDSTTNLTGDPDDTEIDATSILEAAMTPAEPQPAAPPAKPIRRQRKGT